MTSIASARDGIDCLIDIRKDPGDQEMVTGVFFIPAGWYWSGKSVIHFPVVDGGFLDILTPTAGVLEVLGGEVEGGLECGQ